MCGCVVAEDLGFGDSVHGSLAFVSASGDSGYDDADSYADCRERFRTLLGRRRARPSFPAKHVQLAVEPGVIDALVANARLGSSMRQVFENPASHVAATPELAPPA